MTIETGFPAEPFVSFDRELCGIVEQVTDHLDQPGCIALEVWALTPLVRTHRLNTRGE
jgi:hypothetical protein